jgi:preprotein translocase subunit SecD
VSLAVPAPQSKQADPDLKELSTYTLTMDTLNKVDRSMRAAMAEMKKDPKFQEIQKLKAELEALKKNDEPTDAEQQRMETIEQRVDALEEAVTPMKMKDAATISEMAAAFQKEPRLTAALQREGLTTRELSKFMLAMIQAGFAAGMQKAGMLKTTPEGTNPANIKWFLEHEEDIKKLQAAWDGEKHH